MANTVIVLGAGASFEAGLPLGSQLKAKIASLLTMHADYGDVSDRHMKSALFNAAGMSGIPVESIAESARHIVDAMPLVLSIDNYLDQRRDAPSVALVGKLAIARAILHAEAHSRLTLQGRYHRMPMEDLGATWYNEFFQRVCEGCSVRELEKRLEQITMVIFNYDRCFEHFMYHALQRVYPEIGEVGAAGLMARLKVFHPFGVVGRLPWQVTKPGEPDLPPTAFGHEAGGIELVNISKQIKTFTESMDKAENRRLRTAMLGAGRTMFLGFAYAVLNLKLLYGTGGRLPKYEACYGSAKGISPQDQAQIVREIGDLSGMDAGNIHLSDSTCVEMVRDHSRLFAFREARN